MNQADLINILYREYGIPKSLGEDIIKTILKSVVLELKKGNLVRLRNFGTFIARMSRGKIRAKFYASENIFKYYPKGPRKA